MNRLQELFKPIMMKHSKDSVQLAMIVSGVIGDCIEALKPEIELMLKEQAKMVRHACVSALFEVEYAPEEKWINALEQVEHDWVKLED